MSPIDPDALYGVPFLVTTTRNFTAKQRETAIRLAEETGQVFVERALGAFTKLVQHALETGQVAGDITGILVVGRTRCTFWLPDGTEFAYHPGMAVHRIKTLETGGYDPMVDAMGLQPGDKVLDCTAGLCSDLLVASHVVGEEGRVCGLESSLPVAVVVREGLATYESERARLVEAMRRIELVAARSEIVLAAMKPNSWDVVYFDPMFDRPVMQSTGIAPLRPIADPRPLTFRVLRLAARVARRAVVVKDRTGGRWLTDDRFSRIVGGAKSRIGYAVLEGDDLARTAEEGVLA